jgi:ferredoxin
VPVPAADPAARLLHPEVPVELGYTREQAMREASRCLDCGVTPVFDGTRCVLCGGCVDVCPTQCLKLVTLGSLDHTAELEALAARTLGAGADLSAHSAILKDEDRCIRCALCAMRCPVDAITMERVTCVTAWRTAT